MNHSRQPNFYEPTLLLASTSPRRRELIRLLGLNFQIVSVDIDESPHRNESPQQLVARLAKAKAARAAKNFSDAIVVAADTTVSFQNEILGKPRDADDARRMLRILRGTMHTVFSGVTIRGNGTEISELAETRVWMRDYSDAEIETYLATNDPLDKAAAYAVQHRDFSPVARVDGCYANVMGLPLCHLDRALKKFGVGVDAPDRACQAYLQIVCPVAQIILQAK
ncbi:MAG: septum formation protein Maf [Chloroflexi bacterium]|nr:septum formation protein Maf [Chloroflexota bacterium]